jgi:hypothetical protein
MTPRELMLAARALGSHRAMPPGRPELERMMTRFPDSREMDG